MSVEPVMDVLRATAAAVGSALDDLEGWHLAGTRDGQYTHDLVADDAGLGVLRETGYGILSEESGLHEGDDEIVVVIDPVDGSTNASLGLPWYACSLCAVDRDGPLAAHVVNLATGQTFEAVRGRGATVDGRPIARPPTPPLDDAVVAVNGYPRRYLGWRQYRALGAAALDMCSVAAGAFAGYLDCTESEHAPWDYLGALLVCREAGVVVADLHERELVVIDPDARRTPIAASSPELLDQLLARRRDIEIDR